MSDRFGYRVHELGPQVVVNMRGRSWTDADPRCPAPTDLRLLELRHWNFHRRPTWGELVVAERVVEDVVAIFQTLFDLGFAIERMQRIDMYNGDDEASMADNNSSAFNFRTIAGSDRLSHHALGVAIDLNPRTNPIFVGARVQPENGLRERQPFEPGVILRPGPVVEAFESRGWHWGGEWPDMRDTHHFSALPREA